MRVPTWVYLLIGVGLAIGNVSVYRAISAPPVLDVQVLDVGEKGRAILVQSPGGKTVLIDAGADASILRALGSALPLWQRRIDAVVLTSATASNTGGLTDVIRRYRVPVLLRSGVEGSDAQERLIENATGGVRVVELTYGDHLSLGAATVDVLSDNPLTLRVSYVNAVYQISEGGVTTY